MAALPLAKRLKELREHHKYTQEYISAKLNIERASYSNYELGKRTPPLELVISFADFYGITVDGLLKGNIDSYTVANNCSYESITPDESTLLSIYRSLPANDKNEVHNFLKFKQMFVSNN